MGWFELIGTPSVGILHQSDCTWLLLRHPKKKLYISDIIRSVGMHTIFCISCKGPFNVYVDKIWSFF